MKCNTDVALVFVDMSLPAWECGLKSLLERQNRRTPKSLPAWECGLKYKQNRRCIFLLIVTPCVGVWIEINNLSGEGGSQLGHALRGSVD